MPLDDGETYFRRELDAWQQRNGTAQMRELFEELAPITTSLPTILLHLDDIVNNLLKFLNRDSTEASEAILR